MGTDHNSPLLYAGRPGAFGSLGLRSSVFVVVLFSLLISSCLDIRIRVGQRPNTEALEGALRVGQSTPADVLLVLGQPFGKGRAELPIDPKARTMWTYYYEEGSLQDDRRIFLFVFFDQDRYDGYMWFSSLPKEAGGVAQKEKKP